MYCPCADITVLNDMFRGQTQDFSKRVFTKVWTYQYTVQGARNGSDYYEMSMSLLGACPPEIFNQVAILRLHKDEIITEY